MPLLNGLSVSWRCSKFLSNPTPFFFTLPEPKFSINSPRIFFAAARRPPPIITAIVITRLAGEAERRAAAPAGGGCEGGLRLSRISPSVHNCLRVRALHQHEQQPSPVSLHCPSHPSLASQIHGGSARRFSEQQVKNISTFFVGRSTGT